MFKKNIFYEYNKIVLDGSVNSIFAKNLKSNFFIQKTGDVSGVLDNSALLPHFVIPANILLFFGFCLILNGIVIILYSENFLLRVLLGIEVSLLGVSFIYIILSYYLFLPLGQATALVILAVAAVESVIGLGIFLLIYRKNFNLKISSISNLVG